MKKKIFTVLENNPEVMTALVQRLGLPPNLTFYDIFSLDPSDLADRTHPCHAMLAIIPLTSSWAEDRATEDSLGVGESYHNPNSDSPIIWFKQTIGNACGSIGLLHCALNGEYAKYVSPGSLLDKIRKDAIPLGMEERAKMLHDCDEFEIAHQSVAALGDTDMPELPGDEWRGRHFVAFVKADGKLWELEGSRNGPIDRGELGPDEDVLSPRALELGLGRIIKLEKENGDGDLHFSCVAIVDEDSYGRF